MTTELHHVDIEALYDFEPVVDTETTVDFIGLDDDALSNSSPTGTTSSSTISTISSRHSEFYESHVARTMDQCIEELSAPQRTPAWFNARKYSITASVFGALLGHNKYEKPKDALLAKVRARPMDARGLNNCRWGNTHEDLVRSAYENIMKDRLAKKGGTSFTVKEYGLIKSPEQPWMAVSPDGIIDYTVADGTKKRALLEIKCPIKYAERSKHHEHGGAHPYKYSSSIVPNVPLYYYDQIQGIMGYLNNFTTPLDSFDDTGKKILINFCDFVVWSPGYMWITRVPYNNGYFMHGIFGPLKEIYFGQLLHRFAEITEKLRSG